MRKFVGSALIIVILTLQSAVAYADADNIYRMVLEKEIEVLAEEVNIRTGPGMEYQSIGKAVRGDVLQVLGALGSWYVVFLPDGSIGVISSKYSKVKSMNESFMPQGDYEGRDLPGTEAEVVFGVANAARLDNNLPVFVWDEKMNRVAQLKAEDLKDKNSLSHYSVKYGTPFGMLKEIGGFAYKTASENIAGSISIESAMASIMSSPSHRSNILNSKFNKMGVGIVEDAKYGKIIVQMFIQE